MNRSVSCPSSLLKQVIEYRPNVGLMMDPGDAEEEELNPPFICPSRSVTQSSRLHCSPHPDMPLSRGHMHRVNSIAIQSTTSTLTTASNQQT